MSGHVISIGACGWQHPAWDESYYPEGLPEDWQLAYYGNEYPVVLIPDAYWAQGRGAINVWLEETDESPKFICEWSLDSDASAQAMRHDLISALGDRVSGILVPLHSLPDSAQIATIHKLAAAYPVCLDWPNSDRAGIESWLRQHMGQIQLGLCWHGDTAHEADLEYGKMVVVRVNSEGQTPKSLRTILETILAKSANREAVLLFDGQPPDLQVMQQAGVILNLL